MKIIYALNSINYVGGTEITTIRKANALADLGYEIIIAVTDHNPKLTPAIELSPKVKLINLNINYYRNESSKLLRIKKIVSHYIALSRVIHKLKPDIIISVGQCEKYLVPLIVTHTHKIREVHYVSNYRTLINNSKFSKLITHIDFNFFAKLYDKIVLLTKEDLEEYYCGSKKNVTFIHNAINSVGNYTYDINSKTCIAVGRLCDQKNYEHMIRAFELVVKKHEDWKLIICGDGTLKQNLLESIKRYNLENNIFLLGNCNNIPEKLSQSSIFLSTSKFEGLPVGIIEAISCGIPVVSYKFPCGAKDILDNYNCGVLINMNDISHFADELCMLIENPTLRKSMSDNAKQRAKDFDIKATINKWTILFNEVVTRQ